MSTEVELRMGLQIALALVFVAMASGHAVWEVGALTFRWRRFLVELACAAMLLGSVGLEGG